MSETDTKKTVLVVDDTTSNIQTAVRGAFGNFSLQSDVPRPISWGSVSL